MAQSTFTYGVEELQKILREMPKAMKRTDINKASRQAMKPVRRTARSNLRSYGLSSQSTLYKAVKVLTLKRKAQRRYGFYAGVIAGPDYRKAPHAHLYEYGTGMRRRRTGWFRVVKTGRMPAHPFMRPAYVSNRRQVFKAFRRAYSPMLQQRINAIYRRHRV